MKWTLVCAVLVVSCTLSWGCQEKSDGTTTGTDTTATSMENPTQTSQNSLDPNGQWISELDTESPLTLSLQGKELSVSWDATLDSDLSLQGKLQEKGPGLYSGTLDFAAGDAKTRPENTSIRLDASGQSLTLELPVMWEEPVVFQRSGTGASRCAQAGQKIVEQTKRFQDLLAKVDGLGIMEETEDPNAKVQDYQIFEDNGDANVTITRLRVDFEQKQVSEYDAAEDSYNPISGSASLFAGINCD